MNHKNIFVIPITIAFVCLIFLGSGSKEAEFEWLRWRGPNGNGISLETNWNPMAIERGAKVLWKAKLGTGYSNVAIKNDRLYTMGMAEDTNLYCLNALTGEEIWNFAFETWDETLSTPTINGQFVYALSKDGILVCLNIRNGKLKWKKDIVTEYGAVQPFYGFAGAPLVVGDLLILNVNTSGLALNTVTGELVWDSNKPDEKLHPQWIDYTGTDYSTPVLYDRDGKKYALLSSYAGFHSVDIETGKILWLYKRSTENEDIKVDPVVFGTSAYFTAGGDSGCSLLEIAGNEPEVLWNNLNLKGGISSPVIVEGYLYGCHGGPEASGESGTMRCVDTSTGDMLWEKVFDNKTLSLTAADDKLIILEANGILRIAEANPFAYREISSCDVLNGERMIRRFWTPPVLYRGKIYCRNYPGELVCIDVSK